MSSSFSTSVCQLVLTSGTHRVKILGHSLTKGLNNSHELIHCGTFSLVGYQWALLYHPSYTNFHGVTYTSFHLQLLSEAKIAVFLRFSLVNQSSAASLDDSDTKGEAFTYTKKEEINGFHYFKERHSLDKSNYVKDGNFIIQCDLQLIKPSVQIEYSILVPPSDLQQHFNHLLQSGDGADVTFKVGGETFPAHRSILAARSSVFRAELFGSMKENKDTCIEIEDMEKLARKLEVKTF